MLRKVACCLVILSSISLAACMQVIKPTQTPSPTSFPITDTPRPAQTITPTPTSVQVQVDPQQATAAAALTRVADRFSSATAKILTATASAPTPDWDATHQALPAAVMAASIPIIMETYPSPDGLLRAEVIRYDCVQVGGEVENAYEQLKIVQVNDGTETIAADQLQWCGGIGTYGLGGLFWSPDGRYFYFTSSKEGVPDGDFCEIWVRSMARVNVSNGVVENTPGMGELLSDERMMVIPSSNEFILWDLDEGEKMRLPFMFPDALLADYHLSPDKTSLVYLQSDKCAGMPGRTYLTFWEIATANHTLLLIAEDPPLTRITWEHPGMLTLWYSDSTQRQFDLATGVLVP